MIDIPEEQIFQQGLEVVRIRSRSSPLQPLSTMAKHSKLGQ